MKTMNLPRSAGGRWVTRWRRRGRHGGGGRPARPIRVKSFSILFLCALGRVSRHRCVPMRVGVSGRFRTRRRFSQPYRITVLLAQAGE